MTYDEIISEVAGSTGLSKRIVDRTYKAYWKVIREHITTLPLKEDISDEEIRAMQSSVNIPSIGKLYINVKKFHRIRSKNKDN